MVTGPYPLPPPRADPVKRMDDWLEAHPGWSVRYDGQADRIVFTSPRGREVSGFRIRDVLRKLEDGPAPLPGSSAE